MQNFTLVETFVIYFLLEHPQTRAVTLDTVYSRA
jgi:hypothetical protein